MRWVFASLLLGCAALHAQEQVDDTLGIHIVKPGETLWDITRYYLGEDFLWKENWRLNPEIQDPNRLRIGQQLTVIKERRITAEKALVRTVANQVDKNLQRTAWESAQPGDQLAERDGVRTRQSSSAELQFTDDSLLRVGEFSQIFLQQKTTTLRGVDRGRIEVRRGAAELEFAPMSRRRTEIELIAGSAVTRPKPGDDGRGKIAAGADEEDGSARVMVYEGSSLVEAAGSQVSLRKGTGSKVPANGPPSPPEQLLASPRKLEPADGTVWKVANMRVSWRAVPRADHYRVEICRDPACGSLVLRSGPVAETSWQPTLPEAGDHYWRVRGVSASGLEGYASQATLLTLETLRIDDRAPAVAAYPTGPHRWRDGQLLVAPDTELRLTAFDAGIGLDYLEYRWGEGQWERVNEGTRVRIADGGPAPVLQLRAADLLGALSDPVTIRLDVLPAAGP
ncbi:MAG: LysM peptidoglycan-binding domain-containing protein [Pseudomonadota bacterium]